MPTSGGLYWWTHFFSSPKTRNPLCFLVGYSNTLGLVGGLCSIDCEEWEIVSMPNHLLTSDRRVRSYVPLRHRDRPRRQLDAIQRSYLRHLFGLCMLPWNPCVNNV